MSGNPIFPETRTPAVEIEPLRQRFADFGQEHVFDHWNDLGVGQRAQLSAQASQIDLDALAHRHRTIESASATSTSDSIEPASAVALGELGDSQLSDLRHTGEELLRAGRVAATVLAGGQGTRLGFEGPKGGFPIGPVSDRCLFEIQAQRLRNLGHRYGVPLPWYVMTSPATQAATRQLFEERERFELPREDVHFFEQDSVPSLDLSGRLMLERRDRIFVNPDGHGGTLTALLETGTLDEMERRGIDRIFFYQVDNPLVDIGDPVYLGLHESSGAEMSCKVIRKREPMEKVGIVAQVNGQVGMVEYTELQDEERFARDADGDLSFWTGNVAIHVLNTDFVRRVASDADRWLPYHASMKKIPFVDSQGNLQNPAEPNGHKFERFVFDALPAARQVCVLEADRAREYAPVKNATGGESPASARKKISGEYRRWLSEAGIALPDADALIEVDQSRVNGVEDAISLQISRVEQAPDVIRISPGARL